jgi:putative membrane protein
MPSEARRLHPFTTVARALRLARQLLIPAVVGGVSVGGDLRGVLLGTFLILAVPSLVIGAAQWLAFRYRLEGDDLVIDSGVFRRRRRVIPIERVQNVDLEQSPLERLVGVAELRIETATGGVEAEASLTVLPLAEARALRAELLARRGAVPGRGEPEAGQTTLLRLGPVDLVVAGATANEAGLIAAGLATLLEVAGQTGALATLGDRLDDAVATGAAPGVAGAAVVAMLFVLVLLVLGWVVSIVATVVRFHGFTLTRDGQDLRAEHGLLSRHHLTVPLARVQAVRVEETLPRRWLHRVALKIDTAGAGSQAGRGAGGRAQVQVPIAHRRQVAVLLEHALRDPGFAGVALHPVDPASRRRELVRLSAAVVALTLGLAAYGAGRAWAALLLLAPAALLAHARYRARGWTRDAGHVVARDGVLTRTTWVVPEAKVQTLHITQTPFQRRWRLATLLVDTAAGRTARVVDLHRTTAAELVAELGHPAPQHGPGPTPGTGPGPAPRSDLSSPSPDRGDAAPVPPPSRADARDPRPGGPGR